MDVHSRSVRRAALPVVGLLVGLAVGLVAGCTSGPSAAPPTSSATASAEPGLTATELPPGGTVLAAGTYTRTGFEPRITFAVGDGVWHTGQRLAGFFDIQQRSGTPDVIAVQFVRPHGVFGAKSAMVPVETAAAAAAAIQSVPGLKVLDTSESRMSNLSGIVVEVENPAGSGGHISILDTPPGPLGIDAGRRLWIALFDTDDGLLAILVGGSVAQWDAALAEAEPVLESVTIGR